MKLRVLAFFGIVLIVGSAWGATKPTEGATAVTKLSLKNESIARLDQFLGSKSDLASEKILSPLDKSMASFALNSFCPPPPPKPPVSNHCGSWWNWRWDSHHKCWVWGWHW